MIIEIDHLENSDYNLSDSEDEFETLINRILDSSKSINVRIGILEEYYNQENNGDNTIEILSTLASMYQLSGSSVIEQVFYRICSHSQLSVFLRLESAKHILGYDDKENSNDPNQNILLKNRNNSRKNLGYKALDYVCYDIKTLSTPCRVEAIIKLMESLDFRINANIYFCELVKDNEIDCDFRYKTILSLENNILNIIREEFIDLVDDKPFVKYLYTTLGSIIKEFIPSGKYDSENKILWNNIINKLSYNSLHDIYKKKFPDKVDNLNFFMTNAQLAFFFYPTNQIYYRILSGQYLLQKCIIDDCTRNKIEEHLLEFALDEELDYNRRADAADVLLNLGSPNIQIEARNIIKLLGLNASSTNTIFDNSQNVHTQEIEESTTEILSFLVNISTQCIKGSPIDFNYIHSKISRILKRERETHYKQSLGVKKDDILCKYCSSLHSLNIQYEGDCYCSNDCVDLMERENKIMSALNRISIDRLLYSKYNSSLINILLKVWTYIDTHDEHKEEMMKRLLEELEEMSDTCSTGFVTRLVNTISGFGDFNIRISFEDQIISNFTGRLNAAARGITDMDSIFRKDELLNEVIFLWLSSGDISSFQGTQKEITDRFLEIDREEKIEKCIENFSELVLFEMTLSNSCYSNKQHFSLFFRSNISKIREELYEEFKHLVDDISFDFYIMKSIRNYEK